MHRSWSDSGSSATRGQLKHVLFAFMVTTAFALGFYSLYLASANAGKARPLTASGLLRTATATDGEKIGIALGDLAEHDLVYVVVDAPEVDADLDATVAARRASRALTDSGLTVSIRLLDPGDPDFTTIVMQNGISRFPAVLAVKKDGGIVLITDDLSEGNLLRAYRKVWGKMSSCEEAASAIY